MIHNYTNSIFVHLNNEFIILFRDFRQSSKSAHALFNDYSDVLLPLVLGVSWLIAVRRK